MNLLGIAAIASRLGKKNDLDGMGKPLLAVQTFGRLID